MLIYLGYREYIASPIFCKFPANPKIPPIRNTSAVIVNN